MASRYAIETVFKLIDQVSAPTSKVGRALDKLGIKSKTVSNALKHDFNKAAARIDKLGASIKKWGGRAILGGIGAISVGIGLAAKQFMEFDSQLHKAGAIFSDLNPLADDFKTRLEAIGKAARSVAAATEFNAEQAAGALATMAMAGIKSEQAISLLPKVADMATAAGVELDTAVGMAADSLNVFGKMTDDPIKLAENFQYVSDIMVKTANLANMEISDMYGAVKTGGAQFTRANQRIEDFGAAVDILAAIMKGTEAGTKLNTMMTRLSAPVTAGEDALKALGIRTKDTQGNLLNFVDIIEQLRKALGGLGDAQQAEYIKAIFGQRQLTAASALINAGVEGFRVYAEELEKAAGSTQQVAEVMRKAIKNKLARLGSAATELGFKFVEAFQGKAVSAVETLTGVIEKFDVAPLVNFASAAADRIMKFAGVLIGAAKFAWQFRGVIMAITVPLAIINGLFIAGTGIIAVYNKIMAIKKVILGIVTGYQIAEAAAIEGCTVAEAVNAATTKEAIIATRIWAGVMKGAALVQKAFRKATDASTRSTLFNAVAQGIQATTIGVATGAQWAFNAAVIANPIGLIIMGVVAAVAALIAIIVLVVKNWDKITTAVTRAAVWLKAFFSSLGKSISKALEPAIDWLKGAWSAVVNTFTTVWEAAVSFFKNIWNSISAFFSGIWEGIAGVVSNVANWFTGVWQTVTGAFSAAWIWVSDLFVSIWEGIKGTITKFIDWIWPVIDTIIAPFKAIGQAIGSVIDTVGGWFSNAVEAGNTALDEYDKANAKTNAATNANANVLKNVEAELVPPTDMNALISFYDSIPGFGIPGLPDFDSATGAGGNSKLHGVYSFRIEIIGFIYSNN